MRTEEEIKERIKELKSNIDIALFNKAYVLASRYQNEQKVLEWVLESEANNEM